MSKYLKGDMHLHSIRDTYSKEQFVGRICQTDLDIVCVTDHNVIDLELLANERLVNYQSNFAGFELNVHISKNEQSEHDLIQGETGYFHAVVWIKKENACYSVGKLNNLFEHHAKKYENNEYKKVKCKTEKTTLENHKNREGLSVSIEEFKKEFNDIEYYFVAHENKQDQKKNGRSISNYLPTKKGNNDKYKIRLLTHKNVALEGNSGVNNKKIKGNNIIIDHLREAEKVQVSSFRFSDAKTLEEIGEKYNWINFDGTFNGMILPFTDYETRILQSSDSYHNPQLNYNNYLECIKFDMGEEEVELNFEPGYNAIIGSRGSGKSLLGKILGDKYKSNENGLIVSNISKYSNGANGVENTTLKGLYIGQNYFESIFSYDNDFTEIEYVKSIQDKLIKERNDRIKHNIDKFEKILKNLENLIFEYINVEKNIKVSYALNNVNKKELYSAIKYEEPSNYKKILEEIKNYNFEKKEINLFNKKESYKEINSIIIEINELQENLDKKISDLKINLNLDKILINLRMI